ncbi:type II toxin-antitoxin system VapB family antitoxin [Shewanella algae]|uniref:type II toxin-antitoxin system VapB family antitoxin n=1 Tax=Shewanella algae TaxID=38313 RepID=UPI0031F54B1A
MATFILIVYPVDISLMESYILGYVFCISKGDTMTTATATVFQSNRSQAIRLPKAAALPADVKSLDVVIIGRTRIISPAGESWGSWFNGPNVSGDYMSEREQPQHQDREGF